MFNNYAKVFTGVEKQYNEGLRQYMLKVYSYMSIGLLITGISAFLTLNFNPLTHLVFNIGPNGEFFGATGIGLLLMLSPLFIGLYFFWGFGNLDIKKSQTLFWVYSTLTGISIASFGYIYTGASIVRTFFICSSIFAGMSIYGYSTKRDLTSLGNFLVIGLMGILFASVINIFFQSSAIYFVTSILGVVIFVGLIAWDVQKIKAIYFSVGNNGEMAQKIAILGAFKLYLDFINLFLYLLRFFGVRRD